MSTHRDRYRVVAAALLVAATVLVVVGTSVERAQARADQHQEATEVERPGGEAGEHNESAEQAQSEQAEHSESAEQAGGESGEVLFGVDLESVGLTVAAAVVSLLLAGLLLTLARTGVLLVVVVFALGFAALDVHESVHQASEARPGLVGIALLAGVLHLAVAVLAAASLRAPSRMATAR
jgi:hypothetical protein